MQTHLDFGKPDTINTDYNNTDFSETNPINLSGRQTSSEREEFLLKQSDGMDRIDFIQTYTDIIKKNIDYHSLIEGCSLGDKEYIDEIVELMAETVGIGRETLHIAGVEYPYQLIKGKLLKINDSHIQYVLECLHKNTTKIHNIRTYLLTCLFNAPSTIHSYYRAEVNHDMYGIS